MINRSSVSLLALRAGFFLTSVAEKTKTQAKNSRKKLNLREDFPSNCENSRNKILYNFPIKLKIIERAALSWHIH